jgi:hypothetical protein
LQQEALEREEKRLSRAEARDQRNFDLQMARYKLEDDRYARKEQMILDKETKATGGEQALGQIREIAKNVALTTPVGKGMLDQAVKARGGKEYDLSNESDRAEYQRIADLALPSVSRDVLQQAVSPFMAAYGVDAKNIATQLLATDTGRDFDSEAKASKEAAKEANDYAMQLARLQKGVFTDAEGNVIPTSGTRVPTGTTTPKTGSYEFSTKDTGTLPIPFIDINTDNSTKAKFTEGKAFIADTVRKTGKQFNQGIADEAENRFVESRLADSSSGWKSDDSGKISTGGWSDLKDDKNFQTTMLALYNQVEAEKAQEALKRKGQSAFELPTLQGGRSASELEQLAADNAATQFNREILSRYNKPTASTTAAPNRIDASVNQSPVTKEVAVKKENSTEDLIPSLEDSNTADTSNQQLLSNSSNFPVETKNTFLANGPIDRLTSVTNGVVHDTNITKEELDRILNLDPVAKVEALMAPRLQAQEFLQNNPKELERLKQLEKEQAIEQSYPEMLLLPVAGGISHAANTAYKAATYLPRKVIEAGVRKTRGLYDDAATLGREAGNTAKNLINSIKVGTKNPSPAAKEVVETVVANRTRVLNPPVVDRLPRTPTGDRILTYALEEPAILRNNAIKAAID